MNLSEFTYLMIGIIIGTILWQIIRIKSTKRKEVGK